MQSREDTEWGNICWMVLGDVAMPKMNIRGSCSIYRLQMRMKSWRTLGLKASKSLKIMTMGGCSCASVAPELRFLPGVDFLVLLLSQSERVLREQCTFFRLSCV